MKKVDLTSINNSNVFKIIKNILSVIGLIWLLFYVVNIKTYDIRLGFEDSSIIFNIKKCWGLKQERYFAEFNSDKKVWEYYSDGKNTKWATLNKNSKLIPLPEKAGIYDFLPIYEREFTDE